jgi:hypothetical protein
MCIINTFLISELLDNTKEREFKTIFEPLFTLFDGCRDISKFCYYFKIFIGIDVEYLKKNLFLPIK